MVTTQNAPDSSLTTTKSYHYSNETAEKATESRLESPPSRLMDNGRIEDFLGSTKRLDEEYLDLDKKNTNNKTEELEESVLAGKDKEKQLYKVGSGYHTIDDLAEHYGYYFFISSIFRL